ncbi:MAG TPA: CpsD/CapB family tyrosine-protein kinase [Candidatus Eisenbacteria bacterium]|nr:CpsD/CapB family tyrosine-protein kinase [Candidatus Eisenbacteria bacterium]
MRKQDDSAMSSRSKHDSQHNLQTLSAVVLDRLPVQTRPADRSSKDAEVSGFRRADEAITSLALRQRCSRSSWKPDAGSVMLEEALDSTISHEEFRRLRSYLYEVRRKQPLRRLLISSALSGEGKTFVSANLAQTMARRPNESVLVVDGDLRLSRLHRPLGAAASPGLSEYLEGDADIFSVIQRGPMDNLFFVAGGTPKTNPADLISNGRLEVFLQRLAPAFDWIVLDSPPALLVTDATMLAALCDGILLVIRAGITSVDMARKALQMFRNKPLLGTVLNGSQPRTPYKDYYGRSGATAHKKAQRK